jgi:hypothetical protein
MKIFALALLIVLCAGGLYLYLYDPQPTTERAVTNTVDSEANPNSSSVILPASRPGQLNTVEPSNKSLDGEGDGRRTTKISEQKRAEIEQLMAEYNDNISDPAARVEIKKKMAVLMEQYHKTALPAALEQMKLRGEK